MVKNEVIIFAGPHGSGKDTIEGLFTASRTDATRHVRYSSREQANGEVNGQTYHFISQSEFDEMVSRDDFIDYDHYPEGSSGIARQNLIDDASVSRFTSVTTNFQEGLSLTGKICRLQIPSKCLYVSPCPKNVMIDQPDRYLDLLARRMERRGRASDDISLRLGKAALYRELYIPIQDEIPYICNKDGGLDAALDQVNQVLTDHEH